MIGFPLHQARRILCLGAHADDIEIGLGGALLSLLADAPETEVYWAVFTASGDRAAEARRSAEDYLAGVKNREIMIGSFRESYLPSDWAAIKDQFEQIKSRFEPDLIFTHFRHDRHQDHRVISDLAWNTFRDHFILEYEIPKYDGDLATPNVFFPLTAGICQRKIDLLMTHFQTQLGRHWFTRDTFDAMHRIRGIECASPTGFAEAFHVRKAVLTSSR